MKLPGISEMTADLVQNNVFTRTHNLMNTRTLESPFRTNQDIQQHLYDLKEVSNSSEFELKPKALNKPERTKTLDTDSEYIRHLPIS